MRVSKCTIWDLQAKICSAENLKTIQADESRAPETSSGCMKTDNGISGATHRDLLGKAGADKFVLSINDQKLHVSHAHSLRHVQHLLS